MHGIHRNCGRFSHWLLAEGFGVEERPWSVRLAGKLLGMVQQGGSCPWHPYLQVGGGVACCRVAGIRFIHSAVHMHCMLHLT